MNSPSPELCIPPRVAAVVVTFNRLTLLQECIAAIRSQTRPADEIIVVNNGSTDGTLAWLESQPDLFVVTQPNLGSSGGQFTGINTAFERGHDWFWCMDDDTIPHPDALQKMTEAPYYRTADTGCLSSLVLGVDGKVFESSYCQPAGSATWALSILNDRCVQVPVATFVSLLISRRAVETAGLPIKEFFFMRDDWEFTERIGRTFKNYCVLDSRVVHKSPPPKSVEHFAYSKKLLYCVRNEAMRIKLRPLSLGTKTRLLSLDFLNLAFWVLRGRMTWRAPVWFVKGVMQKCTVEFPNR